MSIPLRNDIFSAWAWGTTAAIVIDACAPKDFPDIPPGVLLPVIALSTVYQKDCSLNEKILALKNLSIASLGIIGAYYLAAPLRPPS